MPNLTVSTAVDELMQSADNAAFIAQLGAGTTGAELFGAATAAAARTTLGFDAAVPKIPFGSSLSSEFSTASTSFVNVTGLSFPVLANKNYKVAFALLTNKNNTDGLRIQFTGPASPSRVFARFFGSTSSIGVTAADIQTALSTESSTYNTYNGDGWIQAANAIIISNGANAGTVQLQLRAVTSGTAKILAGSFIEVTEL